MLHVKLSDDIFIIPISFDAFASFHASHTYVFPVWYIYKFQSSG